MRTVRLGTDYTASPLWTESERGWTSTPLERFGLGSELREALRQWAARFDALMLSDYEWPSPQDRTAWVHDGRALATALTQELGEGWVVEYAPEGRKL